MSEGKFSRMDGTAVHATSVWQELVHTRVSQMTLTDDTHAFLLTTLLVVSNSRLFAQSVRHLLVTEKNHAPLAFGPHAFNKWARPFLGDSVLRGRVNREVQTVN